MYKINQIDSDSPTTFTCINFINTDGVFNYFNAISEKPYILWKLKFDFDMKILIEQDLVKQFDCALSVCLVKNYIITIQDKCITIMKDSKETSISIQVLKYDVQFIQKKIIVQKQIQVNKNGRISSLTLQKEVCQNFIQFTYIQEINQSSFIKTIFINEDLFIAQNHEEYSVQFYCQQVMIIQDNILLISKCNDIYFLADSKFSKTSIKSSNLVKNYNNVYLIQGKNILNFPLNSEFSDISDQLVKDIDKYLFQVKFQNDYNKVNGISIQLTEQNTEQYNCLSISNSQLSRIQINNKTICKSNDVSIPQSLVYMLNDLSIISNDLESIEVNIYNNLQLFQVQKIQLQNISSIHFFNDFQIVSQKQRLYLLSKPSPDILVQSLINQNQFQAAFIMSQQNIQNLLCIQTAGLCYAHQLFTDKNITKGFQVLQKVDILTSFYYFQTILQVTISEKTLIGSQLFTDEFLLQNDNFIDQLVQLFIKVYTSGSLQVNTYMSQVMLLFSQNIQAFEFMKQMIQQNTFVLDSTFALSHVNIFTKEIILYIGKYLEFVQIFQLIECKQCKQALIEVSGLGDKEQDIDENIICIYKDYFKHCSFENILHPFQTIISKFRHQLSIDLVNYNQFSEQQQVQLFEAAISTKNYNSSNIDVMVILLFKQYLKSPIKFSDEEISNQIVNSMSSQNTYFKLFQIIPLIQSCHEQLLLLINYNTDVLLSAYLIFFHTKDYGRLLSLNQIQLALFLTTSEELFQNLLKAVIVIQNDVMLQQILKFQQSHYPSFNTTTILNQFSLFQVRKILEVERNEARYKHYELQITTFLTNLLAHLE